jgi:hypothetical protein
MRVSAVYHTIEFKKELVLVLQTSPKQPLERMEIRKGMRRQAQIKPYVRETEDGFVEVADLYFEDGTVTHVVPIASFFFVE